ncbi:histidine kinase [Beutenbergia cavernae DSM 12333]|uniref:Histidine kinase n=2 Tax=Beutenbergia TaxID=84756 RepID=C5C3E4_BEUC1|nr:histidine kinase [Beutenbergia cavernae DSM 12333]
MSGGVGAGPVTGDEPRTRAPWQAGGMRSPWSSRLLRGGAHGVEIYTRVSLYAIAFIELMLLLVPAAVLAETSEGLALAFGLAVLVHVALCVTVLRDGLDRRPASARGVRAALVALGALSVGLIVLAFVAFPSGDQALFPENPRATTVVVVGAFALGALAPRLDIRALTVGMLGVAALAVVGQLTSDEPGVAAVLGLVTFLVGFGYVASVRLSIWILEVVRELDASRDTAARLAVAEERLRISRDMHDVVGRALSTVAVKSELAAELARRDDAGAVREMLDVRTLAQDSLREVRGVVAGYRAADLATELTGARSVLTAAGIRTRIIGDASGLDPRTQEALAWVVREAVTNVVRHADAQECRLEIATDATGTLLRVVNDGAKRPDHASGAGLRGLTERLAELGGTVTTSCDGDTFVLEARLPRPPGEDDRHTGRADTGARR